jgi:hypothetical protein
MPKHHPEGGWGEKGFQKDFSDFSSRKGLREFKAVYSPP